MTHYLKDEFDSLHNTNHLMNRGRGLDLVVRTVDGELPVANRMKRIFDLDRSYQPSGPVTSVRVPTEYSQLDL